MDLVPEEKIFYLSGFRPINTLNPAFAKIPPYPRETLTEWKAALESRGTKCVLRISEGFQG